MTSVRNVAEPVSKRDLHYTTVAGIVARHDAREYSTTVGLRTKKGDIIVRDGLRAKSRI